MHSCIILAFMVASFSVPLRFLEGSIPDATAAHHGLPPPRPNVRPPSARLGCGENQQVIGQPPFAAQMATRWRSCALEGR